MHITHPTKRRGRALAAALAFSVLSAGAAATVQAQEGGNPNDPSLFVAKDKIEHVVRTVEVRSDRPSTRERQELWLTADRSRMVVTDLRTGKVRSEITYADGDARHYDADENTIRTSRQGLDTPPYQSLAQEAAIWKAAYEQGKTRLTGETERFGRRALVLESVEGAWRTDEPDQTTTMVLDAEHFTLYAIRTVLHGKGFSQDVQTASAETLERAGNEHVFAMSPHPGAKRVGAKAAHAKKKHGKKAKKRPRRPARR